MDREPSTPPPWTPGHCCIPPGRRRCREQPSSPANCADGPARSRRTVDPALTTKVYPKPAVAGASDEGPLSGAGFSAGPDRGGTILPVGYGHTWVAGTHTVTLVGKSNPACTTVGVLGTPWEKVTFMARPP